MKRSLLTISLLLLLAATVEAQPRPGVQPPEGRPGRQPGPRPGGPPGFNLMTALDVDGDGKLSPKEIDGAAAALEKLDKNRDGKLSREEIGWPPRGGFPGFGGGRPGGGGPRGFPGFGPPQPQRPGAEEGRVRPSNQFFSRKQISALDRDKDGKVATSEIPRGLRKLILDRLDLNKDGAIDKAELDKLEEKKPPK